MVTNLEIGRQIVEYEQRGEEQAEYGKVLLKALSQSLTEEFGRGFSKRNLEYMRCFYLKYKERVPQIEPINSDQVEKTPQSQSLKVQFSQIVQTVSAQFNLSGSHYILVTGIKDSGGYSFCAIEAVSETCARTDRYMVYLQQRCVNHLIFE